MANQTTAKKIRDNPLKSCHTHREACTCYAIWSDGQGTAFAVGERGTIFRWDSSGITPMHLDGNFDFYDVHGFSATDIWAVGTFGAIWRFDGQKWKVSADTPVGAGEDVWFEAVWGRSSTDLYVVGNMGRIYHRGPGGWTTVTNNERNRFYSIAGLDDGRVYVAGSWCKILLIENGVATKLNYESTTEHLNAIMRVPNTNELLACGTNGTLLRISGKTVTPVDLGELPFARPNFYALDAYNETEIVLVGWSGLTVRYNLSTGQVKRAFSGSNSFLEGVARLGPQRYISAGWYGRIMTFDAQALEWATHQTGRAEEVLGIASSPTGAVLATTDTGNLVHSTSGVAFRMTHAKPTDIPVVVHLHDNEFLLAGKRGLFSHATLRQDGTLTQQAKPSPSDWSAYCSSPCPGGAFLGGTKGRVFRYDGTTLSEVTAFKTATGSEKDVIALARLDDNHFLVRFYEDNNVYRVKLGAGPMVDLNLDSRVIFGGAGTAYLVSKDTLYAVPPTGSPTEVKKLSTLFLTAGEQASAGFVSDKGDLVLGGSHGSVVVIRKTGASLVRHCGTYREITAVEARGDTVRCGLDGGHVRIVNMQQGLVGGHTLSAPTYRAAAATGTAVVMGGDSGTYFHFPASQISVQPGTFPEARDFMTASRLGNGSVCLAGAEIVATVTGGNIDKVMKIGDVVFTASCLIDAKLILGTSAGSVFEATESSVVQGTLTGGTLTSLARDLGSPVVDLARSGNRIRAVLENGRVLHVDDPGNPLHNFKQVLRRGTQPQHGTSTHIAGKLTMKVPDPDKPGQEKNVGRICLLKPNAPITDIPYPTRKSISDTLLHGQVGAGDYWTGGTSGTLYVRANDIWYLVHTGIGNTLFTAAKAGDRFVVGGEFGAVRFEDDAYIRDAIENDKVKPVPLLVSEAAVSFASSFLDADFESPEPWIENRRNKRIRRVWE